MVKEKELHVLPSTPQSIAHVEKIAHEICKRYNVPEDTFGNILIAVTEAVNNAVYHGNKTDKNKKVTIELFNQKNQLVFSIKDEGKGFDYKNLPNPTLPENIPKIGGRGIFIIHQLADKVEFKENGSRVNIHFNLPISVYQKSKKTIIAIFILISSILISCKKNNINSTTTDFGKDYYPIEVGRYIVYDVDSTAYDEITHIPTTYKYRLKEIITEAFINDEGKTAYRLERYIKPYDSTKSYDQISWKIKDVWTIIPYTNSIEKIEENIRYVKLIFPVKKSAQWNGNIKNTLGTKNYTYEYADFSETVNNLFFSKVTKIKQYEYRTSIKYQNEVEKYAKGIGMIYKEIVDLESQTIIPNVPVENRAESGFLYKMNVVEWGRE